MVVVFSISIKYHHNYVIVKLYHFSHGFITDGILSDPNSTAKPAVLLNFRLSKCILLSRVEPAILRMRIQIPQNAIQRGNDLQLQSSKFGCHTAAMLELQCLLVQYCLVG
jgi:hypothetical protein